LTVGEGPEALEAVQVLLRESLRLLREDRSALLGGSIDPAPDRGDQARLVQVGLGPPHPVVEDRLLAARQQLAAVLLGELELGGDPLAQLAHPVLRAVGQGAQEGQH